MAHANPKKLLKTIKIWSSCAGSSTEELLKPRRGLVGRRRRAVMAFAGLAEYALLRFEGEFRIGRLKQTCGVFGQISAWMKGKQHPDPVQASC